MRIICPFCGERASGEFSYLGAAAARRPEPNGVEVERRFVEATYLRDNPAGRHDELWYHAAGCRRWLEVSRDTRTHEIFETRFATEAPRS